MDSSVSLEDRIWFLRVCHHGPFALYSSPGQAIRWLLCSQNVVCRPSGFRRSRSTIDRIFCIRQILEKKWEYNEEVRQLFIDFKKAYDSFRREVLYKILIEFGIPRELVRLIKISLTETYSRVRVGKNVSDRFPIRNGLKQEMLYHQCFLTLL